MCTDCGCQTRAHAGHHHHHHHHDHHHGEAEGEHQQRIQLAAMESDLLAENDRIAESNRAWLKKLGIFAINLISAPGSGKTSLIERMAEDRERIDRPFFVITGDQATERDAQRIAKLGIQAKQINTGSSCHLDARMLHEALHEMELLPNSLLIIENIGNMVCPTAFDLGEDLKFALISVTEGEDKPLKYPDLLIHSKALAFTKADLLPHLEYDQVQALEWAEKINPDLQFFQLSAKTGDGFDCFYKWLHEKMPPF